MDRLSSIRNVPQELPRDLAQLLVALDLQTSISVKKAHKNPEEVPKGTNN